MMLGLTDACLCRCRGQGWDRFYPYFPTINPNGNDFGIDVPSYLQMLNTLNIESGLVGIINENRSFFFIVLLSYKWLAGLDTHNSIRYLPVLLNPLFVAASYYFTWEIFRNSHVAAWCAFLSSTGFVITVGMYAYFLTNNLALCLVLFSTGLLFRAIRESNLMVLGAASFLGCLLVYTHPWTLDQYLAGLVLLLGYFWVKERNWRINKIMYIGVYLIVIGFSEIVKLFIFHSYGGTTATVTVIKGMINLSEMFHFLFFDFPFLYGGFLSNIVLLGLALIGIYLLRERKLPEQYLYIFIILSSLVCFVSLETNKSRILYNIPLSFYGAITLFYIYRKNNLSLTLFLVMYSLFYLFVCIGNVVLIPI